MARISRLLRPRPLVDGDVVRVVAPASPFDPAHLEPGLELLRSWGYRVRHRDDLTARSAWLAGSPQRRADELHEAFEDDEAAAIIAVRGGYGLTTVLPLLDVDRVVAHPKVVIGCSDVTALLSWLVGHAGMTCVHGPMLATLGKGGDAVGAGRLQSLLRASNKPPELTSSLADAGSWCMSPGFGKGRSVGGSLSLLAAQCGTPWQVDGRGSVLFLEDVGERPYRIDRMLVQLQQAGVFDGVQAVVFGDMVGCDEPGSDLSWRDAVDRVFRSLSIPVLLGVPFGHGAPNLPIPLGVEVHVDAGAGFVRFREAPVG